jgi:predicted ATPase
MRAIDSQNYLLEARLDPTSAMDWSSYPLNLPIIKSFTKVEFRAAVTFLIGENGSGKSTLLEAFAIGMGFNPEGGSKNFRFTTFSSHSNLHESLVLTKGIKRPRDGFFLRAESFYNLATRIGYLDKDAPSGPPLTTYYGGRLLHEQSHGESFMALMKHRFRGNGLYILDEPEAALSPRRQLDLLALLDELVHRGSQFIIATHSPIIMSYPGACIYQIEDGVLHEVAYEHTEHYQFTRYFLSNRDKVLEELLADK